MLKFYCFLLAISLLNHYMGKHMTFWYSSQNHPSDVSSKAKDLNFGLSLHLHPYFVYARIKASGESAHSPWHSLLAEAIGTEISRTDPITSLILGSEH